MIILLTIVVELQTCTYPIAPRSPTSGRAVGYREERAEGKNEESIILLRIIAIIFSTN